MRTVTIPYELAERLVDVHLLEPYPPSAYEELRALLDNPGTLPVFEVLPELATPYHVVSPCKWGEDPNYFQVSGSCLVFSKREEAQALADSRNADRAGAMARQLRRRVLEIEGSPSDGYDAWFTDCDGNLNTVVCFSNPMATADWCERNGFAWEVIGLEGDPAQWLADWTAQQ